MPPPKIEPISIELHPRPRFSRYASAPSGPTCDGPPCTCGALRLAAPPDEPATFGSSAKRYPPLR